VYLVGHRNAVGVSQCRVWLERLGVMRSSHAETRSNDTEVPFRRAEIYSRDAEAVFYDGNRHQAAREQA
jgi:hypothetical protein